MAATDMKKLCTFLYCLFAVSAVMQVNLPAMIVGMVALLVGVVILYNKRKAAAGTPYESHVTWMIRTFWIGGAVYMPVITVIAAAVIYTQVDINGLVQRMLDGGISDPLQVEHILETEYGGLFRWIAVGSTLPFLAWWMWRCWRGFWALREDKPVDKPLSWF